MKKVIFLLLIMVASTGYGQAINLPDGEYILTVKGGDASITVPLHLILTGDIPTNPQPTPQPAPSGLAGIVKAEAAKLPASQAANRAKVAAVYLAVAAKLKAGMIPAADVPSQTKSGVSAITGDDFDAWRDFGTAVNKWMADNNANTEAAIIPAYQTIATALNDNASINWLPIIIEVIQAISSGEKFTWATIIPIILEIIKGLA